MQERPSKREGERSWWNGLLCLGAVEKQIMQR